MAGGVDWGLMGTAGRVDLIGMIGGTEEIGPAGKTGDW